MRNSQTLSSSYQIPAEFLYSTIFGPQRDPKDRDLIFHLQLCWISTLLHLSFENVTFSFSFFGPEIKKTSSLEKAWKPHSLYDDPARNGLIASCLSTPLNTAEVMVGILYLNWTISLFSKSLIIEMIDWQWTVKTIQHKYNDSSQLNYAGK